MKTSDISDQVVVDAYQEAFKRGISVVDLLAEETGAPVKVCQCAMTRSHKRGFVTTDKPRIGFDYVPPAGSDMAVEIMLGIKQ